jgi:hypothetical protein
MYRRLAIVDTRLEEAGTLQGRNKEVMLRHFVGENLGIPGIDSLKTFIGLVEPVKHYERGQRQVWENQLVPLIYLADAAQPESAASRDFAIQVDELLFSKGGLDQADAGAISDLLKAWGAAAKEVTDTLVGNFPALREAEVPARALADACAMGREAISSLMSGTSLSADRLAADLVALDRCREPNGAAVELPIVAPVRLLVVAAAKQGARAGLSPDQWRQLVQSTAFPAPVPTK